MNVVMASVLASVVALSGAAPSRFSGWSQGTIRNPQRLRAVQVLDQRASGALPRVRFEWDQVPGATQYVLAGQWTTPTAWTVRSREYRVTPRSATAWRGEQVWFEVALPTGAHSWRVTAIFGPNDRGDFLHPAQLSFELR
jgi:hypothetical protein